MPGQGTHLVAGLEAMEKCPYIKNLSDCAQIEKYLRYLKQPFKENPFVNKEQLIRIIDIYCMFLNDVLCLY